MAQSLQNVTISLTLPISCQICLGKVRQPVICCNNHVFCSNCIKVWLEKSSQCPTCRVAITPENPCREIIGATTASESNESLSVKRHLRKSRGELLMREYEEEIETLLKENEELKSKNLSHEMQLKTALEPSTVLVPQSESSTVDPSVLEESANKLRAANDLYRKVKQDLDRLKAVNKRLLSQNFDLTQENIRLKAEVDSRSPQKFSRHTVAALEARIQQYERDVTQLKRALERSDKYIEELEAQNQRDVFPSEECGRSNTASGGTQNGGVESIALMRRSLSELETSVCTYLDSKCTELPNNHGCLLTTSDVCQRVVFLGETLTAKKDALKDVPSTPSTALRSLSLKSPEVCSDRHLGLKPLTFLRRLSFDDCQGSSSSANQSPGTFQVNKGAPFNQTALNSDKEVLCGDWMDRRATELPHLDENREKFKQPESASSTEDPTGKSETCMDVAYLDKISEQDSMMAEGESSSSQVSHLPLASTSRLPDFDAAHIPVLDFSSNLLADPGPAREHQTTLPTQENTHSVHLDAASTSEEKVSFVECSKRVEGLVENPGQSSKRKCPSGLSISSPSKLSKLK